MMSIVIFIYKKSHFAVAFFYLLVMTIIIIHREMKVLNQVF